MRLVVDSNVLFTFFWKGSVFNRLQSMLDLSAPEFALVEINKYSEELLKKAKISSDEFRRLRRRLASIVEFIPLEEYSEHFRKLEELTAGFTSNDKLEFLNDIDFFALALKLRCPIWSNDRLFKKQSKIVVLNTKELIELLDSV